MKALIIEDEKMARENLARTIAREFPDIEIVGMTGSVRETLDWLASRPSQPDLIFMDVELSDGDCFEIFRKAEILSSVIMTTAYDSYAIKAFEAGSIDYILKPVEMDALRRAVSRCRAKAGNSVDISAIMRALKPLEALEPKEVRPKRERIVVHFNDRIVPINVLDIAYFHSEDKDSFLVTRDGREYVLDISLKTLEEDLDPGRFHRISRSCIVSMDCIRSVTRTPGGGLLLETDPASEFEMTVSRSRCEGFLSWLEGGR